MPESFLAKSPERSPQLRLLIPDDMGAEVPVGPLAVAFLAELLRQVEDDRHRQTVILPGQLDERFPGLRLHVGRVDHRQLPHCQPLASDEPKNLERLLRNGLIVLVVTHHPSAGV